MKQKYGVDLQFPINRYVSGLTSTKVPDRSGEYPPGATGAYQGRTTDCSEPALRSHLPDGSATDAATLCNSNAGRGPRTPDLVYYAHIGGVPNELLTTTPNSPMASAHHRRGLGDDPRQRSAELRLLGHRPAHDRGVPAARGYPGAGRHDRSDQRVRLDHQHRHRPRPRRRSRVRLHLPADHAARLHARRTTAEACDCPSAATLTGGQVPPLCNPSNQTQQVAAKAYPTIRELLLAKLMGNQGIVSSLCPIHVTDMSGDNTDPLYGYRPAITAIVDRLKNALASQCLPFTLTPGSDGSVPCLILATLPNTGATCDPNLGLSAPDPTVLANFQATQEAAWVASGGTKSGNPDPKTLTVCQVQQLTNLSGGTCQGSTSPGWCYVTGTAAGHCSEAIIFGGGAPPTGSTVSLQCISATSGGDAGP